MEEYEKEQGPFMAELENAVAKKWILHYENSEIIITNTAKKEELYINGVCVAKSERNGILSMLKPYQKLNSTFKNSNGTTSTIDVTLGGFITLNLKVKINGELFFKDKIKLFK